MALTLHTNVGFVSTAPTADPAGSDTIIDGSSVVVKDTSPAGAVRITEIGWYRGSGTNAANFEVALYADGAGVATTRLFVDATNSSSSGGWITVAVDWTISPNTPYWLGLQMDAHGGSSTVDSATSGGSGIDILTSQTTLNDPYGGGAVSDADGMYAIYALVEINTPPTVALNSPADASTDSDTTPTLDFTGTDAQGDSIEYQVEVSNRLVTFETITNSFDRGIFGATGTAQARGQSFLTSSAFSAKFITLKMRRNNAPTDNYYVELVSGSIDGTVIGTSEVIAASSVSTSLEEITFIFSTPVSLSAATTYYIRVFRSGARDTSNYLFVNTDNPGAYSDGTHYSNSSGTWSSVGEDMWFRIGEGINAFSETDAGFLNPDTGGDTHPFNSGENIQYTVQGGDALADDTYYWRVRGKDPAGSNTYGAWATTRSFTVSSGGAPAANSNFLAFM